MKEIKHINFDNRNNRNATFDILNLQEFLANEHESKFIYRHHLIEFFAIFFVENGAGKHTIDFEEFTYKKGTVFTIRKDQIHQFHKNNNAKGKLVLFTDDFLISYLNTLQSLKSFQVFNYVLCNPKIQLSEAEFTKIFGIINRIKEEYFDKNDIHSLEIISSELHILITKLYRIKSNEGQLQISKKYLNEFINFQNLVEHNVFKHTKVSFYVKKLGVSTKTLNKITDTIINKSAKKFIDEICTRQIKRLLINTDLSIKEIAFEAGFKEITNFHNYFKRHTNLTPKEFRQTLFNSHFYNS